MSEETLMLNFPAESKTDSAINALKDVVVEMKRQDLTWGEQRHDLLVWNAILGEEFGEFSKEVLECHFSDNAEKPCLSKVYKEAVQCAAVALQILIDLNTQNKEQKP